MERETMQNSEVKRTNETMPLLNVSDFDVEELLELVSVGEGVTLTKSKPRGYLVAVREPIEAVSYKLHEELSSEIEFGAKGADPIRVKQILNNLQMESGLSLYNEIVASVVAASGKHVYEECRDIFLLKMPEPRGFLSTVISAVNQIKFKSGELLLLGKEDYLRVIDKRVKKIGRIGGEALESRICAFVRTMRLIEKLSTLFAGNMGDVESAFAEAIVFGKAIDLIFLKCPRMVQYRDSNGQNRLDVLTHCETVTLRSREGERTYEGDQHLVFYLKSLKTKLAEFGVEVKPVVLVMESDVENMFPINVRTGQSSHYSNVVVPIEDVKQARVKARVYVRSLADKISMCGVSAKVVAVEDLCGGTNYGEIKEAVFDDAYRSKYVIVRSKEFEQTVSDDLERYARIYPNYRREHAKYKVANKVADMRALSAIVRGFENPLVITRGPVPVKQAHLINHGCPKDKRRIIFADPERDASVK